MSGSVPPQGVQLQRTYPTPLPAGVTGTLAYFSDQLGGWVAVPSTVSPDRRSVRATVTHLSMWTDFVGGTREAMTQFTSDLQAAGSAIKDGATALGGTLTEVNNALTKGLTDAADWMYYAVGDVFDVRVDPPSCTGELPDWADSVIFIETNRNNPILWCAGRDTKRPDLVVVKARVNRGFGFPVTTHIPAAWTYNSTYNVGAFQAALDAVTELDKTVAGSIADLVGGGRLVVGPGQEISFGFTEQAARSLGVGKPAVTLQTPTVLTFLHSMLAELVVKDLQLKTEGWVSTTVAVASCGRGISETADPLSASRALLSCLSSADEEIGQLVARALAETGSNPKKAGAGAGLVARVSIYLALVGPVFSSMNYIAETQTVEAARTATIFAKVQRRATAVLTMNPFDGSSHIRAQYTVEDMRGEPVDCAFDTGSPVSRSKNTHSCGSVADSTFACWESPQDADVLVCAYEPWTNKLVLRSAINLKATPVPQDAVPFGIELADGSRWFYRSGGSWPYTPSGTVPAYGCHSGCATGHTSFALLAPEEGPMIDKGAAMWTILKGELAGEGMTPTDLPKPTNEQIAKVWFIG